MGHPGRFRRRDRMRSAGVDMNQIGEIVRKMEAVAGLWEDAARRGMGFWLR